MKDPNYNAHHPAIASYENPRGLPPAWIDGYLKRDRELLAVDVMRAFDETWKLRRKLETAGMKIWILTLLLAGEGALILALLKIVLSR